MLYGVAVADPEEVCRPNSVGFDSQMHESVIKRVLFLFLDEVVLFVKVIGIKEHMTWEMYSSLSTFIEDIRSSETNWNCLDSLGWYSSCCYGSE